MSGGRLDRHIAELGWILDFVSDWLGVKELLSLDSALTQSSIRTQWFALLRCSLNSSLHSLPFFSHQSLRWIITRQIRGITQMRIAKNGVSGEPWHETGQHSFSGACWPNLLSLQINEDVHLDYFGLEDIAPAFPNLTSFVASGATFNASGMLEALSTHCHKLESICIQGATTLRDAALALISNNKSGLHRTLTSLSLQGASEITDRGIMELLRSGSRLKKLNLNQAALLTNASVMMIANTCSQLESLAIADFHSSLTDVAVITLAQRATSLKSIVLNRNYFITDASVDALVRCCPHLESLYVAQCIGVTKQCLQRARAARPSLTIVTSVAH